MTENSFPLFSAFFVRAVRKNTVSARAAEIVRKKKSGSRQAFGLPQTPRGKGKKEIPEYCPLSAKGSAQFPLQNPAVFHAFSAFGCPPRTVQENKWFTGRRRLFSHT